MITFRDIKKVAARVFRALQPTVRTHLVGQVVSYNPATNTAEIQPVVNAVRFGDPDNMTTKQLPVLADVPVQQFGSGKLWFTAPPTEGSYGTLHVADRELETWLTTGGIVDPGDIRMHDLSDCWFQPGIVPLPEDGDNGAFAEAIATDRICLRTRSNVTQISVVDDETVEIKNEKCTIAIDTDGNVTITTDGAITATTGDTITLDNGSQTMSVDGADVKAGTGADYVAMGTPTQINFDLINTIIGTTWVPVPNDGGAALKAAWAAAWAAGAQTVASGNLKAE